MNNETTQAVGAPLERRVRPVFDEAACPAIVVVRAAFNKAKARAHMATTHMACTTNVDPQRQREANALLTTAFDELKKVVMAQLKA